MVAKSAGWLATAAVAALFAAPALGASEAEWAAFRADVAAKCRAAADPLFATATVTVDPFGSERYGLALVEGTARGGGDIAIRAICVYDKTQKTVEIGGELPFRSEPVPAEGRLAGGLPWSGVVDPCGATCSDAIGRLAVEDAAAIVDLAGRVATTIAEVEAVPGIRFDDDAAAVLARLRASDPAAPLAIAAGEHACTVYWYGFLENGGQRMGRHRCTIEARDGRLVLRKTTGDGLLGQLVPLDAGARLFVGRSFLPEHGARNYDPIHTVNPENENFGNKVGFAFADGGGLLLVSADMLGFTEPDATYFEIIAVE